MNRSTPMPENGLAKLADDLTWRDVIVDDEGTQWLIINVRRHDDVVTVLTRDGRGHTGMAAFHRLNPVRVLVLDEPSWPRVLLRGLPWFGIALVAALGVLAVGAPLTGGVGVVIVIAWLVGSVAMVTTPRTRR